MKERSKILPNEIFLFVKIALNKLIFMVYVSFSTFLSLINSYFH